MAALVNKHMKPLIFVSTIVVLTLVAVQMPAATSQTDLFAGGSFVLPVETIQHNAAGISLVVPSGWATETDGDQIMLDSADGTVSIFISVSQHNELEDAIAAIDTDLNKIVKKVKIDGKVQTRELNGMPMFYVEGTGQYGDKSVEFGFGILNAKRPVLIVTLVEIPGGQKHQATFTNLLRSMKRLPEK